jgi:hypothetical protein
MMPPPSIERRHARTLQQALRARAEATENEAIRAAASESLARIERELLPDARMERIAQRLRLAPEQVELLWAIFACSSNGRILPHLEDLGGPHTRRGLSVAVYTMLADLPSPVAQRLANWLAHDNPLVASGLVLARETDDASLAARPYVVSPRLATYLCGDDRAPAPLSLVRPPATVLHDERQRDTVSVIAQILARDVSPVIVVEGPVGSGRVTACACAAGTPLLVLDLRRIGLAQLGDALDILRRECVLSDAIPVLANIDLVLRDRDNRGTEHHLIERVLDDLAGPVIVTTRVHEVELSTQRQLVRTAWTLGDTDVRAKLWAHALDAHSLTVQGDLTGLAHRFAVGPAAIERAVASIQFVHGPSELIGPSELAAGLRHNIAERLTGLARRVEVTQTWDDFVAPGDVRDAVEALIGRVRHGYEVLDRWGYRGKIARGTGVAALLSGPPGTGKTMVAGLIARELDLELYQVDLSQVVSKWVGETEKNLARVFDAAEEGHGLLLFDEADALFAQRSSTVQGAQDRYANLEVNYLLQRVEAFGGITILTTNLETAIDSAIKRRLASHIKFELPDEDERARLWKRNVRTGTAPIDHSVDFDCLAREFPKMSGANIRNAAIAAAFLAANGRAAAIKMDHLYRAARAEYRSMGHVLQEVGGRGPRGSSL